MRAWVEATDVWYYSQLLSTTRRASVSSSKVFVWHRQVDSAGKRLVRFAQPIVWLDPFRALSAEKLLDYARAICRARPAIIWAYAGVLYELARAAQLRDLRLHKPRYIISAAETLHSYMRTVIEEAFGCRVYNLYGSTEAGHVSGECTEGNLHIFEFSCHVEVLDPSGNLTKPGKEGRLILTPLHNYAMPLIRYDLAEVGPRECACDCPLPTLSRITGRAIDFFITREGNFVSGGRVARLLRRCQSILGSQVLQQDIDQMAIFFCGLSDHATSQEDIQRVNEGIRALLGVGPNRLARSRGDSAHC